MWATRRERHNGVLALSSFCPHLPSAFSWRILEDDGNV
ncbi:MAG: hypothetical protein OJF49_004681 [Ktedonobacterales bacterium]|nr:MAG: hypothetical protein OJF49_004681 [Ktedonobacterales bacterium]